MSRSNIFVIELTIYEFMIEREFFSDLNSDEHYDKIQNLFKNGQFSDVHDITKDKIMLKCWLQQYEMIDEYLTNFKTLKAHDH